MVTQPFQVIIQVQIRLLGSLSWYITSHPGQLSLAVPPWVGAMSTSQWTVTLCGWGVKVFDFKLPTVEHEFNKCNFIVRSLFNYV